MRDCRYLYSCFKAWIRSSNIGAKTPLAILRHKIVLVVTRSWKLMSIVSLIIVLITVELNPRLLAQDLPNKQRRDMTLLPCKMNKRSRNWVGFLLGNGSSSICQRTCVSINTSIRSPYICISLGVQADSRSVVLYKTIYLVGRL